MKIFTTPPRNILISLVPSQPKDVECAVDETVSYLQRVQHMLHAGSWARRFFRVLFDYPIYRGLWRFFLKLSRNLEFPWEKVLIKIVFYYHTNSIVVLLFLNGLFLGLFLWFSFSWFGVLFLFFHKGYHYAALAGLKAPASSFRVLSFWAYGCSSQHPQLTVKDDQEKGW